MSKKTNTISFTKAEKKRLETLERRYRKAARTQFEAREIGRAHV